MVTVTVSAHLPGWRFCEPKGPPVHQWVFHIEVRIVVEDGDGIRICVGGTVAFIQGGFAVGAVWRDGNGVQRNLLWCCCYFSHGCGVEVADVRSVWYEASRDEVEERRQTGSLSQCSERLSQVNKRDEISLRLCAGQTLSW